MMKRTGIDLVGFLANAPSLFGEEATMDEEIDPDIAAGTHHGAIRHFDFSNGDILSCVRWDSQYHITSTDIIRALVHRFQDIGRPVVNMKKFEEGVFSDLRSLKPGSDARLEPPRSEFLELLYKHHCVRTQKKQKVFYWNSVPHDLLFREALERDLKREAMGIEPTTKIGDGADPNSVVEIDGVELPLSVPPTLAAHTRIKPAEDSSSSCSKIRVSSAHVSAKPVGEQQGALPDFKQQPQIPTVSSALSLNSMASLSNGEEMIDISPVVYPDSNSSSHVDPIDYGSAFAVTTSAANISTAGATASAQGHNGVNNSSSNSNSNSLTGTSAAQRQPSLSEYVTRKSSSQDANDTSDLQTSGSISSSYDIPGGFIPINDSWTGVNFLALHKQASDLRKNYDEYQPTPTPHHSPKEGAVSEKELLDMLDANPNALMTADNIGSFNTLLEQLLGSSGRVQETPQQTSATGASTQGLLFGDSPSLYQSQSQPQPHFGFGQQSSVGIGAITAGPPVNVDLGLGLVGGIGSMGINVTASMNSSPSVASLMNAQRISADGTPETMDSLQFGGVSMPSVSAAVSGDQDSSIFVDNQAFSLDVIDSLIASAGTTGSVLPAARGDIGLATRSIDDSSSNNNEPLAFPPYNAAIAIGNSQTALDGTKGASALKQTWSNQKPNNTPNHRSTRFSRYHPYLKTMARIAHRDSPTLLNRVPSTADPNVAAAAVNAIAAKIDEDNRTASSSAQQGAAPSECNANMFGSSPSVAQQGSEFEMLSTSDSHEPGSFAGATGRSTIKRPGQRAGKCDDGSGEDVRRYVCTYSGCTKLFKRHEHLKRHFRTHTGERPYKCSMPDCGKVFARMDNLNQHARTHINRKTTDRRVGGGSSNTNDSKGSISAQGQQFQSEPRFQQAQIDGGDNGQLTQLNAFSIGGNSGIPPAFGDMSLFNAGGLPSFVPGVATSSILPAASIAPVSAAGLSGVQQNDYGASATGNVRNFNDIIYIAKDLSSTDSQNGMRVSEPPEDLAMFNRGLVANSISSYSQQQLLKQQQQPALQSPAIENNAVSVLRKMSKNNRPRGIVAESNLGVNSGDGNNADGDSAYGFRNYPQQQQFMSALASNAMSAFSNTVEQAGSNNGVGFGDLQPINSGGSSGAMGLSTLPRTLAGESNVSSISTTWLASFLAQSQQQQQQQQSPSLNSMQANVSSPPAYLSPYNGNMLMNLQSNAVASAGRQTSLKRHLDDEEDSDVVMRSSSKDRSRQSMNVSEDEHSDGKAHPKSSSGTHKYVRPSIAPKPTLSPV